MNLSPQQAHFGNPCQPAEEACLIHEQTWMSLLSNGMFSFSLVFFLSGSKHPIYRNPGLPPSEGTKCSLLLLIQVPHTLTVLYFL